MALSMQSLFHLYAVCTTFISKLIMSFVTSSSGCTAFLIDVLSASAEHFSILNLPLVNFTLRIWRMSGATVARRWHTTARSCFSFRLSRISTLFGVISPECALHVCNSFKTFSVFFFFNSSFFKTDSLLALFTVWMKFLSTFFTFATSSEFLAHFHLGLFSSDDCWVNVGSTSNLLVKITSFLESVSFEVDPPLMLILLSSFANSLSQPKFVSGA